MDRGRLCYTAYPDGGFSAGYVDYNVECFGGGSYEARYTLDCDNAEKLMQVIGKTETESRLDALCRVFGNYMEKESFDTFCKNNEIEFELYTWID